MSWQFDPASWSQPQSIVHVTMRYTFWLEFHRVFQRQSSQPAFCFLGRQRWRGWRGGGAAACAKIGRIVAAVCVGSRCGAAGAAVFRAVCCRARARARARTKPQDGFGKVEAGWSWIRKLNLGVKVTAAHLHTPNSARPRHSLLLRRLRLLFGLFWVANGWRRRPPPPYARPIPAARCGARVVICSMQLKMRSNRWGHVHLHIAVFGAPYLRGDESRNAAMWISAASATSHAAAWNADAQSGWEGGWGGGVGLSTHVPDWDPDRSKGGTLQHPFCWVHCYGSADGPRAMW